MSFLPPETTEAATGNGPQAGRSILFASASGGFQPMLRGPQVFYAPDVDAGSEAEPMSMDDAISLLTSDDAAPEDGDDDEDEAGEDEDPADDQSADGDDAPDEDEPASDEDSEEDEDDAPAEPASDAPKFWSAEEKALFAKAPPEVRQLVAAKTAEAEQRVYAAKEEAAAARKDASIIGDVVAAVDQQLQRAQQIFLGKWEGVDWQQWAKDAPDEALAAKFEFDAEQAEISRLQTAQAATEAEEHRQFIKAEAARLAEAKHVLADPAKGPAEKRALIAYAQEQGYDAASLKWAGAMELTTLHKAMLWDKASKRLATKPPAELAKEKTGGAVRPSSSPPPRKTIAAQKKAVVVGRAFKTGKMDDAVSALLALED